MCKLNNAWSAQGANLQLQQQSQSAAKPGDLATRILGLRHIAKHCATLPLQMMARRHFCWRAMHPSASSFGCDVS